MYQSSYQQTNYQGTRGQQGRSSFGSTRDLVSLLFRRRTIFLTVFVTIFAASAFSLRNQQVVFVAGTKVLVIRGAGPTKGSEARPDLHWWEEMKTEVEVARSREVAELAVALLARQTAIEAVDQGGVSELDGVEIQPVSTDLLIGGLGVEPIDETDIIRITYRALDRRAAIDGANALTKAYMDRSRGVLRDPHAANIYNDELALAEESADLLSAEIATYKTKHGISDINSEIIELTRQRKAVQAKLIEVRARKQTTELEIGMLERIRREQPEILLPSEEMKRDPQLNTYMRRLGELDAQLNTLLATYTRDNPQVRAVERDRESCIVSISGQVDQFIAGKRATVEKLGGERQAYDTELRQLDRLIGEMPVYEANLRRLSSRLDMAQEHLDRVREHQLDRQLRENVDPEFSKLRLLSGAVQATRLGGGARKQLFLAASVFLAFGLSFVAAFMVDTLDHSIKFPSDIEEALGVPVLASIREMRGAAQVAEPAAAESSG